VLSVVGTLATAALDFGRNGSVDRTLSWLVPNLVVEAD